MFVYKEVILLVISLTIFSVKSDYYECNEPLLDKAVLKATSSLNDRGPENARLNGDHTWTAGASDFDQKLIIDLGATMMIKAITIQGRPHSNEYVEEYSISYGSNGYDYTDYKERGGNVKMFKGNVNGDDAHQNFFEIPVIAQWIRINPTRWRDRISLRVELYGCGYVADHLYFNGSSLVRWDLRRSPISSSRESIKFRFKTTNMHGVLMYSRSQSDFFALQLRDNRMLLNIDLGSGLMTSLSVGSLLDDNIWHDVVISRNRKDIVFSVDRVVIHGTVNGEFSRLNLNREFFIGGVPNIREGLVVYQNFTGCIENLYMNSTNVVSLIKEGYSSYDESLMATYQKVNTLYSCPDPPIIPVTFLTARSHAILKGYEGMPSLNASLAFRTYEEGGLLLYHQFTTVGYVKLYLEEGKVKVEIKTDNNPKAFLDNYEERFNDGKWHTCVLTISKNSLILDVDHRPMKTIRLLNMATGSTYLIGGGVQSMPGFIGCMRMITIDGNYRLPTDWKSDEYCCELEVEFDTCQMIDRCNPNPCKHEGTCRQSSKEFFCDCTNTGYSGAVCHTSLNSLSCEAYRNVNPVGQSAEIKIDVDGSGPLKPFLVTCEFYADGRTMTNVHHSNEEPTPVDGFQEPGSFKQDIIYDADFQQMDALVSRSSSCRQRLTYECKESRLLNSPAQNLEEFRPFSWWVSRHNQKMDYWAGSIPGTRKCECGITGTCKDNTKWCNCDSGLESWLADGGDIMEKEHLPVKQLRFGDTGNHLDEKMGRYTLGPLQCEGDDLFNNVVTIRVLDATIDLPTFDMGHSGDIYLEFKTTIENAVILHSKGPNDYIQLQIIGGNKLQFTYDAGTGPHGFGVQSASKFADNKWHTVSIERNRKEARMVVDGAHRAEVREPDGPVRALHLTSKLVIGATVDNRDGYVGCIRALLLNGKPINLRTHAEKGLYGIVPGCIGKCDSNPCLNNGTCLEEYNGYSCNCRWTAFKGPICADEIGVNMRPSSMIKYDFMGSWRSTMQENIRVGFTTTNPKGFLLGLFSNVSGEYMTIMVSNSGHLRVVFDFGFERQELIFPNKHFALGQYHDVRLTRKNQGSTLVLTVDNYEPVDYHFNIKESADAQFNNVQYLYIGKNESMQEGFTGCVSRVEFDDIYPLKLFFQENGPANVKSYGPRVNEDFCGVEPVTHPPEISETRPPLILDQEKILAAYHYWDSAILGGILCLIFLAILILLLVLGRYVARHKGEYLTQEDKGADDAMDPDSAVVRSTTGPQVQKRREWFI